jgi:hypothetical protein
MKKSLAAFALAAALVQPASAITFPSLTTIYIGAGVYDLKDYPTAGTNTATSVHCSNVSGQSAQIRVLVLNASGTVAGQTTQAIAHGATVTVSTNEVGAYADEVLGLVNSNRGVLNVEATQSGIFCTAQIVDTAAALSTSSPLRLVRVNPHPGTVE